MEGKSTQQQQSNTSNSSQGALRPGTATEAASAGNIQQAYGQGHGVQTPSSSKQMPKTSNVTLNVRNYSLNTVNHTFNNQKSDVYNVKYQVNLNGLDKGAINNININNFEKGAGAEAANINFNPQVAVVQQPLSKNQPSPGSILANKGASGAGSRGNSAQQVASAQPKHSTPSNNNSFNQQNMQKILNTQRLSRDNSLQKSAPGGMNNEGGQATTSGSTQQTQQSQQQPNQTISSYLLQQQQNLSQHQAKLGAAKSSVSPMRGHNGSSSTRNSIGTTKNAPIAQSTDINSTSSSRPTINYKNIQGGISQANQSSNASKSQNFSGGIQNAINQSASSMTGPRGSNNQIRNGSTQGASKMLGGTMRGSTSSSMIGVGSRGKNGIQASAGQAPRQSSYGPTGTTNSNQYTPTGYSHLKNNSRDNVLDGGYSVNKNAISSKRGSTRPEGVSGQISASKVSSGNHNLIVNAAQQSLNNRSNSRTSGHSALSNVSGNGAQNTSNVSGGGYGGSSLNLINTRLSEQQNTINKHVEKEKRYLGKIKDLKAENKKLMQLLKDSEKLFTQKVQEAKQQSLSLSMLIKQLWPVIQKKVKDPQRLLTTINQCMTSSAKNGQTTPMQPLIESIELSTSNDPQKVVQPAKVMNTNTTGSDSQANTSDLMKQHQLEIQQMQKSYQEQMIELDNQTNQMLLQKEEEIESMQKNIFLQMQMIEKAPASLNSMAIGSSICKALDIDIDIEDEEQFFIQTYPNSLEGTLQYTKNHQNSQSMGNTLRQQSKQKSNSKQQRSSQFMMFERQQNNFVGNAALDHQRLTQRVGRNERNQRQSQDVVESDNVNQVGVSGLQYSKSASNLNLKQSTIIHRPANFGERGGTVTGVQSSNNFGEKRGQYIKSSSSQAYNDEQQRQGGGHSGGRSRSSVQNQNPQVQGIDNDYPIGSNTTRFQPRQLTAGQMQQPGSNGSQAANVSTKNTFSFGGFR